MMFVMTMTLLLSGAAPQPCVSGPGAPALDHVVLAVRDLEPATQSLRAHGFRIKPGRLHANNLLNRHVKFRDGTSLELMTVRGEALDAMARDYAELIAAAEGGVYLALSGADVDTVARTAAALALATRRSASGPWKFLSFPGESAAAAVFFSSGKAAVQDADSLLAHLPNVVGLIEVWLEGGAELGTLLERLGAVRCGSLSAQGSTGVRYALRGGSVVLVPAQPRIRPRVYGVTLQLSSPGAARTIRPHPNFWVHYRYDPR